MEATVGGQTPPAIVAIMESMGWTDGTFIPIANEENKLLMQQMQTLLTRKEAASNGHQQVEQRVRTLVERSKHANDDIGQNGKLLEAHRSQLSDEQHMFKMAEHTDGTLTKRHKELRNNMCDLQKHDTAAIAQIEHSNAAITKLSSQIKWSRDVLTEWRLAMERGEQTNKLIARYCQQDVKSVQALEVRRQALETEINRTKTALFDANEEQRSLETVLDRTAQMYRQAHHERRQLVETWKDTVRALRARDLEIEQNVAGLNEMHEQSVAKKKRLKEEQEFLEQQLKSNSETEADTAEQNARGAQLRSLLVAVTDEVALKQNDALTLKKLVRSLSAALQQKRQSNRQAGIELIEKTAQLDKLIASVDAMRIKYDAFRGKRFDAQERLRHLDELVDGEEKQITVIVSETSRLSGALFRSQHMVRQWKDEHKVLETQIASIESAAAAAEASVASLERELCRQMEIVYNIDYKTTVLQARLVRMRGNQSVVDPEVTRKMYALEELSAEKRRNVDIVKRQVLKIEDDMRQLTANISQATGELKRLHDKLDFQRLQFEGGRKELATTTHQNHEQLVEVSMMKLRVHQMDVRMQQQRDKVYDLSMHQSDLQLAMDQRLMEIASRKAMLQQKRKHLNEELAQLKADIGERTLKIQAVQARYENAVQRLGHNEDGTFVTATQIRIETAQEKQILLRDGNELNERVLRAENDINAIETTLQMLNYSNEAYRKIMEPVKEDNKEMLELNEATAMCAELQDQIKALKRDVADRVALLQRLEIQQQECEQKLQHIHKERMDNNDIMLRLHKEILEQNSKQDRAQRELKLARRTARTKVADAEYFGAFERQLKVRELEAGNTASLQRLAAMADETAGMTPYLTKLLYERGLNVPPACSTSSATGNVFDGDGRVQKSVSSRSLVGSIRGGSDAALSIGSDESPSSRSSIRGSSKASSFRSYGGYTAATSDRPTSDGGCVGSTAAGPAVITLDFPIPLNPSLSTTTPSTVGIVGGTKRRSK